jgi:hypothetical protein
MSLQCFYKLGVITYFTLNREYIAEVLCINKAEPIPICQGSCFLKKNLNLADEAPGSNGQTSGRQQTVEFPVFLISQVIYNFSFVPGNATGSSHYSTGISPGHRTSPFHPPSEFIA